MPELFQRADRDYSSGCVRVARPVELAQFILRANPGWNAQNIRATMDDPNVNDRRETVKQTSPSTSSTGPARSMGDGRVRFDSDIYATT